MEVLDAKEASTVEDASGFTKPTVKTTQKPQAGPWWPSCFGSTNPE